ncbi:SPOR domain-containing protein [Agrobacterium tumefaciens]|nr:SPOR domain-containing protein [Agrobacterium tumefaciens]NTE21418.1 SPOR domain-containing protein [Agrobacterium tumefaciens]
MDILSYLFELLQQRKEVGVTSLGTFYKKKYPGRYDKEKQSFLPPGFTLQFTREVNEDNLLEDYVSVKRNISKESAQYYISQFVDEINQLLEQDHEAILDRIGRLYFTEHEGLSFDPAQNITYGSEFFGLPTLSDTVTAEVKPEVIKEDEAEVHTEIAEAPVSSSPFANKSYHHPAIENIEPDEVKDDFKNTLKHTENPAEEITEAPDFIKDQHAEHPNRFGHTPEEETAVNAIKHPNEQVSTSNEIEESNLEENTPLDATITEAPEFIKEQHTEQPNRFGHTPEEETAVNATTNSNDDIQASTDAETNIISNKNTEEEPIIDTPEVVKAQHAEHPNRFGHTPESEVEHKAAVQNETENTTAQQETNLTENNSTSDKIAFQEPNSVQTVDYSSRFSLRSETEAPKTYINLEENTEEVEPVIDAPQFIKEQHAEHPNRFGHDPIVSEDETPQGMSTWLKITIIILVLLIIAAITYLVKPELFNGQAETAPSAKTVIDSPKAAIDTTKARQDSAAKTDSILKVNQVQQKTDSLGKLSKKPVVKPAVETPAENKIATNTDPSTFNVIAASFQSEKKALVFIKQMEKIGLKAEIAKLPGRLKKVSIASFKTQKEAEAQKEILQKKLKGKGFFVQQIFTNTQP